MPSPKFSFNFYKKGTWKIEKKIKEKWRNLDMKNIVIFTIEKFILFKNGEIHYL